MKRAALLAIALSLMLAVPPFAPAQRRRSTHSRKVSALKGQLSELHRKKAALKQQLHNNKAMTSQVLNEIAQVDQRLNTVEDELGQTTARLDESRVQQKVVGGQLSEATQQLSVVTAKVKERLSRIYAAGPTSTLSLVLGSHTSGEIASRSDIMSQIARSDQAVFNEYKALRLRVLDRKQAADNLVVQISTLAQRQHAEQEELKDTRQEKSHKVQVLKEQAGELEEAIAQFDKDERQIEGQIAAFTREMERTNATLPAFVGRFGRPVPGGITSGFGYRYHPILHRTRLHAGIDFHAPIGTPVHAAASGVIIAGQYMRGYGNTIMIAHGSGLSTVYGHLSRIYVRGGQHVAKGQVIGASGSTGLSTGPHLHFEIRVNGRPVNPLGRV